MDHDAILLDDNDDEALLDLFLLSVCTWTELPCPRNPSLIDQRMAWGTYAERHCARGTFQIRLRMSFDSFNVLLGHIRQDLLVNETQAKHRGGTILPELCLYCTIRWLAGGSYLDITHICGISKSSFYRVAWKTITAIVKCDALRPVFPTSTEDIGSAICGFASISDQGVINNCVGAIDGYLLRIKVPLAKEVKNVKSFFSGHYQCYGVNIQAVADHHCRFLFLAFSGPLA